MGRCFEWTIIRNPKFTLNEVFVTGLQYYDFQRLEITNEAKRINKLWFN